MKAFGLGNPSLTKKLPSASGVDEPSSAHIMAVKVFVASIIEAIITALPARPIAEPEEQIWHLLSYQLFLPLLYLQDFTSAPVCTDIIRIRNYACKNCIHGSNLLNLRDF